MGGQPTTHKVIEALNRNYDGKVVTIDELVGDTGLSGQQIRSVMQRLVNDPGMSLEVATRGRVWRYSSATPDPEPMYVLAEEEEEPEDDNLYEVVGTTASTGNVVVRGNNTHTLYTVVPL